MKAADARLIINQRSAVWLVVGAAERRRRGTSAIRCDLRGREEAKGRRRPVASATETRFTGVDGEGRRTRGGEHGWGKTRGDAGTCVDAGGGGGGRKEGVSSPTKEGRVRGQIPPRGFITSSRAAQESHTFLCFTRVQFLWVLLAALQPVCLLPPAFQSQRLLGSDERKMASFAVRLQGTEMMYQVGNIIL